MAWTELNRGRHKGRTLPEVMFRDPDWFYWAYDEGVLAKWGLGAEAERIHLRASRILPRVPREVEEEDPNREADVEYFVDRSDGGFESFNVVPRSWPRYQGRATLRRRYLDFAVPHEISDYDKLGGRLFVASLKAHLFGSDTYRINRKRAEAFFDDDSYFDLSNTAA
jgi:hypothetical protein